MYSSPVDVYSRMFVLNRRDMAEGNQKAVKHFVFLCNKSYFPFVCPLFVHRIQYISLFMWLAKKFQLQNLGVEMKTHRLLYLAGTKKITNTFYVLQYPFIKWRIQSGLLLYLQHYLQHLNIFLPELLLRHEAIEARRCFWRRTTGCYHGFWTRDKEFCAAHDP